MFSGSRYRQSFYIKHAWRSVFLLFGTGRQLSCIQLFLLTFPISSLPSFPIRGGTFRPSERYLKLSLGALRIHTCCIPEARR